MADGFIQLSVDSTGKKIDTRTEATNLEHRQVMVLGDPATNAGVAPVDATKGLAVDLSATGANSTKLLVTPDLPTGASTAAKQPALGTAGSASADVISVQGIASMTALKTDGSAVTQPASVADGASVTMGAKADAKSAATDTTPISAISILKQISASVQAPPSQAVTNTGTFAVQATMTSTTITGTVAVTESGTWNVGSSSATGSAIPANAFYQGVNAQTALPTAATAGNLTGITGDKFGRAVVLPGTIRDLVGTQTTTISASTAETTIVTGAASVFNDLTMLVVSNTSGSASRVDFRDTTAGTVLFSLYVPAADTRGFSPPRPIPQTSVNTNWTAQSSASVTDLRIYAVFDKNR